MRRASWLTPSEVRLAALLFLLAVLSRGLAWLEQEHPERAAWIAALEPGDFAPPGPDSLGFRAPERPVKPDPPEPGSLDPNSATAEELCGLPGIGPALAQRILADRAENGAYREAADLARVKGIGPATVERVRPFLTLP